MKTTYTYFKIFIIALLFLSGAINAQETDSTKTQIIYNEAALGIAKDGSISVVEEVKKHIPQKAAMYSAVLPGLGQIYNKRYWKLPIVYGAIGGGAYAVVWNQKNYKEFLNAYKIRISGGQDDYYNILSTEEQLISWMDYYRNQRDLSVIITIGLYALNILDAYVDAHLINFNISKDLAMKVEPTAFPNSNALAGNYFTYGLKLSFDIK